ncbi:hypothetical protein CWI42_021280 [Ordospora colligata]|uniref:Uncharacterized protein n=1 Tax=Ordospora colligata OC4 TaxID=1354746 RepID=A0A0B2UGW9_9MICR|nr:uncharacterized protein M896_021290 [Ordospora colligata OC4]KHN70291.1 hypothetical protein M896_021290 [Ordospora colligata OC4]TBU16835.1 hypothetical protein CWI41_021300 [Ordospora colligata]TBU16943.1 hypothetical protein CWI40_021300 [Ordospora colligata]TBU19384.1 hypothetical protein CWI42_021280 [Ordospora colligata]
MSVESIKRLVQCENDAKERLETARKELEDTKAQARADAKIMLEGLKKENEQKLHVLENEVREYMKLVEEKLGTELEDRIRALNNIRDRERIVSVLVEHVCGVEKK